MNHDAMKKQRLSILNRIAPYLILALMLAASVWLWRFWTNAETIRAQSHFDEYCEEISRPIADRLNAYKMILQGGAGVFLAFQEVNREEWRAYVEYRQVQLLYPGIQGLGFAKVIAPAELARHVERVRAEGFPEYSVRPDGERTLYTSIVFLEPFDARNRRAFGYDMFSEPVRRAAMERARDTATPALSDRVHLVQETDEEVQAGFLFYVPVFARGMPQTGVEERRAALTGYVYAPFRVKDLMRGIFAEAPRKVAFELYDGATVSPEALLFASRELNGGIGNGHRARFSSHTPLELYGHTWTLAFHSTPQFEAAEAPFLPWIILAAGLAVSILVFLLLRSQRSIIAKSAALAAKLTVALRRNEQRLTYLNTVSPTVVYMLDAADCSPTWVSPNVTALTGYSPDEALQPGWWAVRLHPEDRERALATCAAVFNTGRVVHEYRFQRKGGEFVWILDELRMLRDDQGNPVEIVGSWLDVTERRQAEDAVRQAKEDWEKTFDAVPDGIMILDLEYRVKQVNRASAALLGMQQADCLGRTCYELVHGTVEPPSYCPHVLLLEDGQTHTVEIREERLGKDLTLSAFPLRDSEGCLVGAVHVTRDITERVLVMAKLSESESRFSNMFMNAPIGMAQVAPDGSWLKVNQALCRILGYSEEELLQGAFQDLTHPDDLEADLASVRQMLAGAIHTYQMEKRYFRKNGHAIWALLSLSLVRDPEGQPLYFISQIQDITERKQAESDRIARQAAEAANRAKSFFLANMSHEIRTPLNSILGFAQILERDASLTPRQAGMLHTISRSGRHLLNLINDILDMSKIEAGRLELSPVDFCLHDLLDDLEMMFRSRTQAKQLQLLMELDDSLSCHVNADEDKLRQVLINLMGNAIKFTKTGGVAVRVRGETVMGNAVGDANAVRLVVEVEDSGPGIAEDELGRIFEPFRQSAAGRDAGGTGLGLTVSRRLVELMGGSLTVRSQVGKGSCFRFDALVKLAVGAAQEQAPTMRQVVGLEPGTGPFRILVVDDQKDNRDLLAALLAPLGFEIREAGNGQEALDVFEAWSPHAVLMDMRMPTLDGYEATRRIKATELGRATPVIVVTASAFEDAESGVLATGVDGYVRKPFRVEEIFAVLGKCLGLRYVYAEGTGQAPEQAGVQPLTREDLAALPEALRQAMRQAVDEGDMAGLQALIAQVEEKDAEAALKLRNLADQYDYETLTQVLAKRGEGESDE